MNKAELQAILAIAKKLGWNGKPVKEVIDTITKMVRNQQALEIDSVGECDDFEETLLSLATWEADEIRSVMYISDGQLLWTVGLI